MTTTAQLLDQLRAFAAARDWNKFHTPKNLATGLSIEAAELLEIFLWSDDRDSSQLEEGKLAKLKEEIGDVQLFLLNLADKFGLDPLECALQKLAINEQKYPAERVRGSAKKYDEYPAD